LIRDAVDVLNGGDTMEGTVGHKFHQFIHIYSPYPTYIENPER
jgi:hypothetical protein